MLKRTLPLLLALALLLSPAASPARAADCEVFGLISASTTWSPSVCPAYIVSGNITVDAGVTLTLAPGTVVRFNQGRDLIVKGTLVARGTAAAGVRLTANQSAPKPGDWGQISFAEGSSDGLVDAAGRYLSGSVFEYATVEYAGGGNRPAVQTVDSSPLIVRSTFRQNRVTAVYLGYNPGFLTRVMFSLFEQNARTGDTFPTEGGGLNIGGDLIAGPNGSRFLVYGNTFRDNYGSNGGGLHLDGGEGLVSSNLFFGNQATNAGGGLFAGPAYRGTITVSGNTFRQNQAGSGGGIRAGSSAAIYGNTVVDNTATGGGGGILMEYGALVGNLIAGNTAAGCGGGVQIYWALVAPFRDNTLAGNSDADGGPDLCNATVRSVGDNNAENNWWGTTVRSQIGARIYDNVDDVDYTLVDFEPFLGAAPGAQAAISAAGGGTANSPDGGVRMTVPAGGLSANATATLINAGTPGAPLPAGSTLVRGFSASFVTADGLTPRLLKPVSITLSYTAAQLAAAGVGDAALNVARFDGERWVSLLPCAGCGVDRAGRRVTVVTSQVGELALVGERELIFLPALQR